MAATGHVACRPQFEDCRIPCPRSWHRGRSVVSKVPEVNVQPRVAVEAPGARCHGTKSLSRRDSRLRDHVGPISSAVTSSEEYSVVPSRPSAVKRKVPCAALRRRGRERSGVDDLDLGCDRFSSAHPHVGERHLAVFGDVDATSGAVVDEVVAGAPYDPVIRAILSVKPLAPVPPPDAVQALIALGGFARETATTPRTRGRFSGRRRELGAGRLATRVLPSRQPRPLPP